jgi:hypothetical protein
LSLREEIEMLVKVSGPIVQEYKQKTPSLAFIPQWSDEKLSILISRLQVDQAVAYLRIVPDFKERFLSLSPPFLSEMVIDELKTESRITADEENAALESFLSVVKEMVANKEVDLATMFEAKADANDLNNVVQIKGA